MAEGGGGGDPALLEGFDRTAVAGIGVGGQIHGLVVLALLTGMRRGEICALEWKNIDFEEKKIHICENRVHGEKSVIEKAPKSEASNRTIPMSKELTSMTHPPEVGGMTLVSIPQGLRQSK